MTKEMQVDDKVILDLPGTTETFVVEKVVREKVIDLVPGRLRLVGKTYKIKPVDTSKSEERPDPTI